MIFNTYYAEKERLMTRIPNFRPRDHGSHVVDLFEEVTGKHTTTAREPPCRPVCRF